MTAAISRKSSSGAATLSRLFLPIQSPIAGTTWDDAITKKYIDRTQQYLPMLDVLLLEEARVVAGGWGVPIDWDGTRADLPDGYDGAGQGGRRP